MSTHKNHMPVLHNSHIQVIFAYYDLGRNKVHGRENQKPKALPAYFQYVHVASIVLVHYSCIVTHDVIFMCK